MVKNTLFPERDIEKQILQIITSRITKEMSALYFRPKKGHELAVTYKGALINTNVYQRSNRFRLEDYTLNQYSD